jgi:hypothetical protein
MTNILNTYEEGIKAYSHEREIFNRLFRKRKQFSEKDFDKWFYMREYKRPIHFVHKTAPNTIILGDYTGSYWSKMLNLLQIMTFTDRVKTKTENGIVIYYKDK